jgi:hypothetical protein
MYDREYYKVGSLKAGVVTLTQPEDTRQLNALQFLNCGENLYASTTPSESEIRSLESYFCGLRMDSRVEASEETLYVGDAVQRQKLIWTRSKDLRLKPRFSFCTMLNKHRGEHEQMDRIQERIPGMVDRLASAFPGSGG